MNPLEELKNYIEYLEAIGIAYIPASKELLKFVKSETSFEEDSIEKLKNKLKECKACALHRIRKQAIWGEGETSADLMLISEYPDREEDFHNKPFVGEIEKLLIRMLAAIGLKKQDFFITHAVKCKTPGNRPPEPEEVLACKPILLKQIKLIKPKLILAMGFTPPKIFFEKKLSFSSIRGKVFKVKEIPILFTYHPAYVIKNPATKRLVWEDLQKFKHLYIKFVKSS
ncbi:MAG: uracil-DNA glycosylase [Thermodesulfobacteria bacterium]|nr:uracil-DNA glycosylase [Thermodesulfobacteriota bacterium]